MSSNPRVPRRFTQEQISRANSVSIVDYAKSRGLNLKRMGASYKVTDYSGGFYLTPGKNLWNWFDQERGGDVIHLCMELENKTWVEAVKTLLGDDILQSVSYTQYRNNEPAPEPKPFKLSDKNATYKHVFAYLIQSRGIDPGIVKQMVDKKMIYENIQKSCVFVGYDKEGNPKHASVRSTNTEGNAFKQDVAGSQKEYSFSVSGTSDLVNVCEAPIDVLSYMSLQKHYGLPVNDSYISLGGVTDKALEHFLSEHPEITKIRMCTDNDQAGNHCVEKVFEKYSGRYKVTRHRPKHKDFNEDLIEIRKNEIQEHTGELKEKNIKEDPPYYMKGKNSTLVICDSKTEIEAYRELQTIQMERFFGESGYEPEECYLEYRSAEQIDSFLKDHTEIEHILINTSNTAMGEAAAKDIISKCSDMKYEELVNRNSNMRFHRFKPELEYYTDDLKQFKMEEVIEKQIQTGQAVEAEMSVVVGG